MPPRTTAITGTAGEHLVAARLAGMGYVVALTRGGSPNIDLLVSTQDAQNSLSLQVKTSADAYRPRVKHPEETHWEWQMSEKAIDLKASSLWYAFVDLKGWPEVRSGETLAHPEVFLVPSDIVAAEIRDEKAKKWTKYLFMVYSNEVDEYRERWDRLVEALKGKKSP